MLRGVSLVRERVPSFDEYPFSIPAVRALGTLEINPGVTYFVGENGSGKSTLIEAIAIAAGFNAEGGSKSFSFSTHRSESILHQALRLSRGARRERDGFFLRAESLFNVASEIERLDKDDEGPAGPKLRDAYGGTYLHEQSHGESFIALMVNRFRGSGLYILDEPEAALSPQRQLALLSLMHALVSEKRSQFIIATHSPIVMAYPGATIYLLSSSGICQIAYEETAHVQLTRDFLLHRDHYLLELFRAD
jgi:predicted ATPase